jgi:hypothetical protein
MAFNGKTGSLVNLDGFIKVLDVEEHYFKFDGTAATLELPVKLEQIRQFTATVDNGTAATNSPEVVYIAEARSATTGIISVPSSGEITINRAIPAGATATTDLGVFLRIEGKS